MNILPRYREILTILVVFLVCSECFPSKYKKAGNHRRTTRSHLKGHGHGKKNTKKDSVRTSSQEVMAAVMHPGKLDMREEKELSQLQNYNKEYINNEMAAETSLLANQGIDDDSALKISNIEALPNALRGSYTSSKTKINDMKDDSATMSKQSVAAYSPDEYLLDANSWPEYKIKDSDYMSRNFRVYPQLSNEGEGGYQGGMMSYEARGRMDEDAGMPEGPYGDGNYGFPQPPQMVSDQTGPTQLSDEGSHITSRPMKEHTNKHPAGQGFSDVTVGSSNNSSRNSSHHSTEGGSGSGEGSGSSDPVLKQSKTPSHSKKATSGNIKSNMKAADGKVEGTVAEAGRKGAAGLSLGGSGTAEGGSGDEGGATGADKIGVGSHGAKETSATETKGNGDSSQTLTSQAKPEPPATVTKTPTESMKQTSDKTQNPPANGKSDSATAESAPTPIDPPEKNDSNSSRGASAKEITNALSQAQGDTPLGQFAEFLKSKGITLTINKDKAAGNSNDAQTSAKGDQPGFTMLASALPSSGDSSNPNTSTKVTESQDTQATNVNNAVMNWQNVAPQSGQIGQLFLRQSTKQGHKN